ncbi:oligosaccharide flippase family protein [Novosphingobium beihaiensis]|uniref:Oligosaccharide flippase family protein n=1 Tax=Novosphingobium beihaiensis TaxID=2930389 RepID=A0ABT0BUW1_9SPHN|nr:oligosaccharide flippase family protein [Novosphingobium beihaiensis]MCJ2188856.1 oligosaccharide flippase family protein [Novosphingobium beihaiensis]
MPYRSIIDRLLHADIGQLVRGLAAYGGAEVITRIVRIGTIVVIARQVSPAVMGAAALALSLFELIRVLANAGIGQRIIAADAQDLDATCNQASRLFWLWCGGIALVQLGVAAVLFGYFAMADIALMLVVLSGVYLVMPGGLVPVFLLMREGRMAATARIAATQTLADHLLTFVLVLIWPSAWAIVLPKLLTSPIWLGMARRARQWQPNPAAGYMPVRYFREFGAGVLVAELVNAGRLQLDKLIVGAVFGAKALGIYYFAFNAGLGITTSFVSALGTVLFPYICGGKDDAARLLRCRQGMLLALGVFLPVLAAQIGLAHIYVPVIFGEQWAQAAPLVSILGLGAVPIVLATVATAWLRVEGRTGIDAAVSTAASTAALAGLALAASFGLTAAAGGYVFGLAIVLIPMSIYVLNRVFVSFPLQEKMA